MPTFSLSHTVSLCTNTPLPLTPAHTHTSPSHTTSHTLLTLKHPPHTHLPLTLSHTHTSILLPNTHTSLSHTSPHPHTHSSLSPSHTPLLTHTPPHTHTSHPHTHLPLTLTHTPPHTHTPLILTHLPLTLTHTPPPLTHTSSCEERLTSVKCPVLRLACSTTSDWEEQLWSQCTGKLECKTLNLI